MQPNTHWTTSTNHLVRLCHRALLVMIPIVEEAKIPWKEPNAYDDWDEISEAIHHSLVIRSLEHSKEASQFLPIPGYGFSLSTYDNNSFISDASSTELTAFVRFDTQLTALDYVLLAILDDDMKVVGERRLANASANFVFCCRSPDKTQHTIDALSIET